MGESSCSSQINKMNFKFLLAVFVVTLALMPTPTEAGCALNGCCWCTQNGDVVTIGNKRPNCNDGYTCACGFNAGQNLYYGECADPQRAPLILAYRPGTA